MLILNLSVKSKRKGLTVPISGANLAKLASSRVGVQSARLFFGLEGFFASAHVNGGCCGEQHDMKGGGF